MTEWLNLQALRSAADVAAAVAAPVDEHILLDDNKYIADVLYEFKNSKQKDTQSKLLFKKRMFRETDETITEPQFVNLSYVQASPPPAAVRRLQHMLKQSG